MALLQWVHFSLVLLGDLCLREVVWFDLDVCWALLFWVSAVCVFEVFCCRRDGLVTAVSF